MKKVLLVSSLLMAGIAVCVSCSRPAPGSAAGDGVNLPVAAKPGQASVTTARPNAQVKMIRFSGYDWKVKSSAGRVGPGPNYFSDSDDNVEVDAQGRLRMRITQRDGRWYCAEVISARSFGYGTYRFYLDSKVDQMDPRIVLGLFTWSDAPAYSHREIDIEIARWGRADNENGQFVVQPYTRPENIVRFRVPEGLDASTHSFTWRRDRILCQSLKGHYVKPPGKGSIIHQHTFTRGIPQAGAENARINLWLMAGRAPANGKEAEIIISKFEFVPLP